jgi:hypothetical protein
MKPRWKHEGVNPFKYELLDEDSFYEGRDSHGTGSPAEP